MVASSLRPSDRRTFVFREADSFQLQGRANEEVIGPHALVRVVGFSSVRRLENLDSDPLPVSSHHEAIIAFVREMRGCIAIEVASIVSKAVERLSAAVVGVA